ncbi:MAG: two-component sensor histidine kinase [Bacteroidia bacterium]|nr:two-component sensor histidine kinase [Bacteroidia bacterium]
MKTQTKAAILIGLFCITIVVLFGFAIYFFLNKYSFGDFYKRLETRLSIAEKFYLERDSLNTEKVRQLFDQHLEKLDKEQEYVIELKSGVSIQGVSNTHDFPKLFLETLMQTGKGQARKGNTFYAGLSENIKGKRYLIVVSAENYYASHHLIFLRNIILISVLLVILIVLFFSFYFSRQIFFPLSRIMDKVKQISTESINLRLDENNRSVEIRKLVKTFNELLSRIETSFETQNNFISNASHELRTPLTAIIGEADVALLKQRSHEEYQKSLQNILTQAERLDEITNSLFFLAQTGYKGKSILFERVRTDEVIFEAKALIDRINPRNKISIDLSLIPDEPSKLKIKANKQLLHIAFCNLLGNACKYSNNNLVTVYVASTDNQVIISIKDQGIGIPEPEISYLLDPFFRASNANLFEGYGIGLPLTKNIINLHNGQIIVKSQLNKGTSVQIKLPLYLD